MGLQVSEWLWSGVTHSITTVIPVSQFDNMINIFHTELQMLKLLMQVLQQTCMCTQFQHNTLFRLLTKHFYFAIEIGIVHISPLWAPALCKITIPFTCMNDYLNIYIQGLCPRCRSLSSMINPGCSWPLSMFYSHIPHRLLHNGESGQWGRKWQQPSRPLFCGSLSSLTSKWSPLTP